MHKKTLSLCAGLLILLICLTLAGHFILHYRFSKTELSGTLSAVLYSDGQAVGSTCITFQGAVSKSLLEPQPAYAGTFSIEALPQTCPEPPRPAPRAAISWREDLSTQYLRYYVDGAVEHFGLSDLMVNDTLTEAAVTLEDGRIAATSEEWYRTYLAELVAASG